VEEGVRLAETSPEASGELSPDSRAIADETRAIAYIYARDDRAEPHLRLLLEVEGDDEDFRKLLDEPSSDGRTWRERLLGKARPVGEGE
jgi:hypothetical protein